MTDSQEIYEGSLQETVVSMVDTALSGIVELEDKRGYQSRNTAEHEFLTNTLISGMIYLQRCGIKPYKNEDKS